MNLVRHQLVGICGLVLAIAGRAACGQLPGPMALTYEQAKGDNGPVSKTNDTIAVPDLNMPVVWPNSKAAQSPSTAASANGTHGAPATGKHERLTADRRRARKVKRHVFPLDTIQRLRDQATAARSMPGNGPDGWSRSPADPMQVLNIFDCLQAKKGLVLRAYVYNQTTLGTGKVWAMSATSPFPDPATQPGFPPKPATALEQAMDGVVGDGSPWSYLCASILNRELAEFGARWHGSNWTTHRLIAGEPPRPVLTEGETFATNSSSQTDSDARITIRTVDWNWLGAKPTQWKPQVIVGKGVVTVIFHTFSPLGREGIYRHVDIYSPGNYRPKSAIEKIADGPHYMLQ